VALALREAELDWEQRFELLDEHVLGRVPLVLLLDNFEDNLDAERRVVEPLDELLARWAERPEHKSRASAGNGDSPTTIGCSTGPVGTPARRHACCSAS
jgi:hypothetical protein